MPRTSYDRSIRVPKPYLGGYIVRVINSPALTLLPGYSTQIGLAFYYMLLSVDQHLAYMDPICDFLYHLKYMLMGDRVKDQVEKIICTLRPAVKLRLRFITHSSKMEPASAAASAATAAASAPQPPNVSSPAPQSSAQGPVNVPLSVAQLDEKVGQATDDTILIKMVPLKSGENAGWLARQQHGSKKPEWNRFKNQI